MEECDTLRSRENESECDDGAREKDNRGQRERETLNGLILNFLLLHSCGGRSVSVLRMLYTHLQEGAILLVMTVTRNAALVPG